MAEAGGSNRVSTWVGSLAAATSAIFAVVTAYHISFSAKPNLTWVVACLVEAIVILVLAIFILKRKPVALPRGMKARNKKIIKALFESVTNDFSSQIAELSRSQLSLYGRQVRNAQVQLLEILPRFTTSPEVRATDIVRWLDLWPTRGVYLRANQRFIAGGGRTHRIFLIALRLLANEHDVRALNDIMRTHKDMGVNVGLHLLDLLSPEYAEDYVVYSNECVLVEIEQGDIDFSQGKVTVFFDPKVVDTYKGKFKYIDTSNDTKSADEIYDLFKRIFIDPSPQQGSFEQKKSLFLKEAR